MCLPPKSDFLAYSRQKTHVTHVLWCTIPLKYAPRRSFWAKISVPQAQIWLPQAHSETPPGPPRVQGRFLARQVDLVLGFPTRIWVFWPKPHVFGKKHQKIDFWVIFPNKRIQNHFGGRMDPKGTSMRHYTQWWLSLWGTSSCNRHKNEHFWSQTLIKWLIFCLKSHPFSACTDRESSRFITPL